MDRRDQELLDKQFRFDPPQNLNGATIGLITVAALLLIGDILSKSKQANTDYAAMVSRIAEASPHPLLQKRAKSGGPDESAAGL